MSFEAIQMATMVFAVAAYLIGSLSFAVIVSRMFGLPDPHSYGSGNPGATNVLRTGKRLAAALTLAGDTGKRRAGRWSWPGISPRTMAWT